MKVSTGVKTILLFGAALTAQTLSAAYGTFYFDPVNGSDSNNGLTPKTAFKTLAKKGSYAVQGNHDEYRLLPGVYHESLGLYESALRVVGWGNSPEDVIIDGDGTREGITCDSSKSESFVANLTVRNATYGLNCSKSYSVISNCVVYGCCNSGIRIVSPHDVVTHCVISNCTSTTYAGGILISGSGDGQIVRDTEIYCCTNANSSEDAGNGNGGAIAIFNTAASVYNVKIRDCATKATPSYGGGIYRQPVRSSGTYYPTTTIGVISNCVITGCTSANGGGIGLMHLKTGLIVTDCVVSNNTATQHGGGVYSSSNIGYEAGPFVFTRNQLIDNVTAGNGGGFSGTVLSNMMSHCVIRGNVAGKGTTGGHGGGVYSWYCWPALVDSCIIEGNRAMRTDDWYFGGGYDCTAGYTRFRNCLFADNVIAYGSGGAVGINDKGATNVPLDFENCTFVGNKFTKNGGASGGAAIGTRMSSKVSATNCVFYGNTGSTVNMQIGENVPVTAFGYCFETDVWGKRLTDGVNHNIVKNVNPLTNDAHTVYVVRRGYGRDAGCNDFEWVAAAKAKDLGGKPRVRDGVVDFGCYEYWTHPGLLFFLQ